MKDHKYAVITEGSVHIPGDERSRTNPGHGYPAHNKTYTTIEEFDTEEKLIEWLKRNEKTKCRVIKFEEISVARTVNFTLGDTP